MGETEAERAEICSASQHSSLVGFLAPFSAPLSPRQCRPLSLGSEKTPLDTVQQDQEEIQFESGVVVAHTCNPGSQEPEAGGLL